PTFDLKAFVDTHFRLPSAQMEEIPEAHTIEEYIEKMWPILRKEMKKNSEWDTLIPLPNPHIVPGGRFRECFYWDSYFTALGLPITYIKEMVQNFAHLIDLFGFIPNGNRIYFTSRSQPPYFSFLLKLLYDKGEKDFALTFTPHLEKEYLYWTSHQTPLSSYFDALSTPRPEAYKRELELAKTSDDPQFFSHLRAACASGWDFSSRWLADGKTFATIQALDLLPVDLNSLLLHLEETLYLFSSNPTYQLAADQRKRALQTLFWQSDFFFDIDMHTKKPTPSKTLAGATPLFTRAATQAQADAVAKILEKDFLLPGGFVTSLKESGHQWDMPNGWAPLQWITIQGLLNYGHKELALEGARRFLALIKKIYQETGTLHEKYNVRDCSLSVARGEYHPQQGFGWTNGVASALTHLLQKH
ncbi:MAG: trehalase, partial [Chlamydiia bacterium]|nr:trehalase [Chlamydiia bacterium]